MLTELHVRDLGVIADLGLVLGPGMTAVTGETGAGKTLLVEAIELLVGGRADPVLVRPGAEEARVEGRFVEGDHEVVLARAIPRSGRSRAYVDGRLATAGELAEAGRSLVDLHGQHAHQSLLRAVEQRSALDRFGAVDLRPLDAARARVAGIDAELASLGGDARARAREVDLLRFQVAELDAAGLGDPDEDEALAAEEELLAGAEAHREAGSRAHDALVGEGGAVDTLGQAVDACGGRRPFVELETRLRGAAAEVAEAAADLRDAVEGIVADPERLDAVTRRRRLLWELCRKYGERLSDVMAYQAEVTARLGELERHDERVTALEAERAHARRAVDAAAATVGRARRAAAPRLAEAVEGHLQELALAGARFDVVVGDDRPGADGPGGEGPGNDRPGGEGPGDHVTFLLAANRGEPALPLAKVASGGELARTMLAARLVLTEGPATLVFDEVDAGVGGQAALAVGRALAALADDRQVLVVTHLPQVAAFADHQVTVAKAERGGRTVADARALAGGDRVVELSRMLSGQPASATARDHAEELLATASRQRGR